MMDKGQKQLDEALDLRSILKVRKDLHQLKQLLFSKQQRWLFKHQGSNYLNIRDGEDDSQEIHTGSDKTCEEGMQNLHGWVCKSQLDRLLVKKVFKAF